MENVKLSVLEVIPRTKLKQAKWNKHKAFRKFYRKQFNENFNFW